MIYPPVDVAHFIQEPGELDPADRAVLATLPKDFLLGVSRFVPYKRLEAVIDAGIAADEPVVLAGAGPDESRLRELARRHPGARELRAITRRCPSFACSTVARGRWCSPRSRTSASSRSRRWPRARPSSRTRSAERPSPCVDGMTGALVHTWSPDELRAALERADRVRAEDCVARAREFDTQVFIDRMRSWVKDERRGRGDRV